MRVPVWFNCGRGIWDTGLIESAIAGKLWPTSLEFEVVPEPQPGGVAVIHGEIALSKPAPIPDQTVIIHGGDEHRQWQPPKLERSCVWSQHAMPGQWQPDRKVVPAWPPDTRDLMAGMERRPLAERRLWGFAGQATNQSRKSFIGAASGLAGGEVHVSPGFSLGMDRKDYLRFLCDTAIAPSPGGSVDPEGFRLYEAIEAGCLPVAQRSYPGWHAGMDWWHWTLGEAPSFPVVDNWQEFPALVGRYAEDKLALQRDANRAGAWWLRYKRGYALNLEADLAEVGASVGKLPGLGSDVTVLISSSAIPGHPSTDLISDTIRRVRAYPELAACEVLIMLDGLPADEAHRAADYEEYKRRLVELCAWHPDFFGCLPIIFDRHVHQAEMTRQALEMVRTPLVFFVEHDTYPLGPIDFPAIARALTCPDAPDLIRLSIWHGILDEHRHLYPEQRMVREVEGAPLIKTIDWSQRPHLARTDWYRKLLAEYVPVGHPIWIEHAMYGPAVAAPWEKFRMMVYAPEGDMTRSGHSDGRRWKP